MYVKSTYVNVFILFNTFYYFSLNLCIYILKENIYYICICNLYLYYFDNMQLLNASDITKK